MAKDLDLSEFGGTPQLDLSEFQTAPAKPSGAIRKLVADKALGFASGAVGATKAIADAAGAGNKVSNVLADVNTGINDYLSPEAKSDQQEQSAIMADAQGKGTWEGIKAGAKAFAVAPVQTAVQGLGSVAPILAGSVLTGGAVPAAVAGAGIGAAMGAGTAKGAIFDDIKKRSLASGMSELDATAAATKAQEYTGKNTDQIALGGALGAADALTGVSGAVGRMARGALHKPATQALVNSAERGIVGRAAMGIVGEMPLEAAQGGQEQLAANIAAQRAGFQAGTWDNVASNATLEALASAGPGAAFGALERAPAPPVAPPAPPEVVATPPATAPNLSLNPQTQLTQVQSEEVGDPNVPQTQAPDGRAILNAQQEQQRLQREAEIAANRAVSSPDDEILASTGYLDRPAPIKRSEAMGLNPAAGPLSAAAATAVDTGVHDGIKLQEASAADQAAYDQATSAQAQQDAEQDTIDKPITTGPLAEATLSDEDKRAILFSNKTVADGGIQYEGTRDGDILNGMGKPYPTRFAAARRANMEGKDWTIAPVFDGFVARRKDAIDGKSTDLPAVATGTDRGRVSEPASGVAPGVGNSIAAGPALDAGRAGDQPGREPVSSAAGVDAEAVTNQVPASVQQAPAAIKTVAAAIDEAAHGAATSPNNDLPQPTEAQKIAGNYAKGHVKLNGLDLSIENPAGSIRSGKDKTGKAWENTIQHHYGYIKGTMGNDKDHVDLFVKPETPLDYSGPVFVIDQIHPDTGKFDEHKVMVGFPNMLAAKAAYQSNYAKGWKGMQAMTPMPFDEFKTWVKAGPKNTPLAHSPESALKNKASQGATQQVQVNQPSPDVPLKTVESVQSPGTVRPISDQSSSGNATPTNQVAQPADQKRAKAIERIAKGSAYFSNGLKAQQFIAQNGLKATHEAVKTSATRWDVKAKDSQPQEQISGTQTPQAVQAEEKRPQAPAAAVAQAAPEAPSEKRSPEADHQAAKEDVARRRAEQSNAEKARAEYFTPGNIVRGYGGFDEVLAYNAPTEPAGRWSVLVHEVKDVDGQWVRQGKPQDARTHSTQPEERLLKNGPFRKLKAAAGETVPYSQPRADGKVFQNAQDRGVAPEDGIVIKQGKGFIKDKFLSEVDGDGVPGGPFDTEDEARAAAEAWREKKAERATENASERSRRDALAERIKAGAEPTAAEIKSLDLAAGESDIRWFFPTAANLFGLTSRQIRPLVADLIRVGYNDMSTKRELVPTKKALMAIGKSLAGTKETPAAKPTGKIEDSGQVLEGARKLYAKAYAAKLDEGMGMDTAAVPLSKSWPEPDYQRMLDDGADPWAVAFAHAARDEIPTKPSKAWKVKGWVEKVQMMREFSSKVLAGDGAYGLENVKTKTMSAGLADWMNKVDLYEAVGHANSLKGVTFSKGEYGMYGGQTFSPAKTLWAITEPSKSASATWSHGNWGNEIAVADTKEEAIEKFKAWSEAQGEKAPAAVKGTVFDIYSYRSKPGMFIIGKRLSARKSIDLKTFPSAKEAREYKANHQDELEKLLEAAKFVPPERRESNAPRVGADHRNGADVTTEQFREAFGFRGEQFGASMPQGERQSNLNQAYDALMDLAGVIGIPPKALSLNGELGLAFGARGIGGKNAPMAHYERDTTGAVTPNRVVINLTRKSGAGSLAHEWFHGVDNYFARMQGQQSGMMTDRITQDDRVRIEMKDAFRGLMKTINLTGMKQRSQVLDNKRTKEYWTTGLEMAARSFESYVIAKLQDQNASNDYLANIVGETLFALQDAYPYPSAGEMPQIRAAFDHFFDTVQTRQDDAGNVAMFSRSAMKSIDANVRRGMASLAKALDEKNPGDSAAGRATAEPTSTAASLTRDGRVAGFGEIVAQEFGNGNSEPSFGRGAQTQATQSVEKLVNAIAAKWDNAPEIVVAFDMQDDRIPERVRQEDLKQRSGGAAGTPEGFYYAGKVYLMSSQLATPNDVARVLFHETLGHYGLRGHFGGALKPILQQIVTMRRAEVKAKAEQYGLDVNNKADMLQAAEEVLAEMAQSQPNIGFVKRAIAAIRNWLRTNVPGFSNLKMTDADIIEQFILPARAFVERGGDGGPKGGISVFSRGKNEAMTNSNDVVGNQGGRSADDNQRSTPAERSEAKSVKSKLDSLRPPNMPDAAFEELKKFEVVSKSPYSDSFYDITNKSWESDPDVFLRMADHWNFKTFDDVLHAKTDVEPPKNSWTLALHKKEGGYEVLKSWPFDTVRAPEIRRGQEFSAFKKIYSERSQKQQEIIRKVLTSPMAASQMFGRLDGTGRRHMETLLQTRVFSEVSAKEALAEDRFVGVPGLREYAAENPLAKRIYFVQPQHVPQVAELIGVGDEGVPAAQRLGYAANAGAEAPNGAKSIGDSGNDSTNRNATEVSAVGANSKPDTESGANTGGVNRSIPNESTAPDSGGAMFSRSIGDTLNAATNSVRDVKLPAGYKVADLIGSVPGKLNWWHKTIGTQYNLAQRSAPFKRVFDSVQNFINDVSFFATEAADLAPNILPKLESWKDIAKSPLSPADTKAISAPIFEGTLTWARDESGKPVKLEALEAAAAKLTVDQKSQRLLRGDHLSHGVMKMWRGLEQDQYEALINSKYESAMLKAGVVWSNAELKSMFGLTDQQIPLYREFRAATDKSLTNLAVADMLRFGGKDVDPIREQVLAAKNVTGAANTLADYLRSLTDIDPERAAVLTDTADKMIDKGDKAKDLIDRGYAPLSRFGQYTLDVVHNGERVYFGMFENRFDAARMNRQMQAEYPGATISQGTVSEQAYKMFAGVSPETLELFGDMLGLEATGDGAANEAFQTYLKLAKSSRSAMKRLIQRKGIAGFNEDAGRVLAGFVYSNARQTASSLHMGEMTQAATDKDAFGHHGELQDAAAKLVDYIKNPQEEAQAFRGLLFAQYIGGSIASAMVNMTQPLTMTFPWLAQFGGVTNAAKQMAAAVKDANKPKTGDAQLDAALHRAEEDGTVSPQEVHQLMQQAQGRGALRSGDGTKVGNAMATASNTMSRIMLAWGKPFSWAEQFNRRSTFIAAYRVAVAEGMADPDAFARRAISETQGVYNKGNKPAWARGALGSTLFTFKQYSISYVEMLQRMANNGPEGKKAALLALGVLFLLSGASGMPGADDLDDIISGAMQGMGYNFDSKTKRKEFFVGLFGEGGAQFLERGVSGLPGVPIDVSGRMGLGNLVPGTGLFTKKPDHTRDVAEFAGPGGDLVKRGFDAAGKLITGDVTGAATSVSPKAIQNLAQAYDMANMGMYRDAKGMKVISTDGYDALSKAIGFQPNDVKRSQDASFEVQRMIGLNRINESEIANQWALGLFEKDPAKVQAARDDLAAWNAANPESPIRIKFSQIAQRVKKMNETKQERIAKTAPKEIRASVRAELAASR